MAGFKFTNPSVEVEIEDKKYEVNLGDGDLLEKVSTWGKKLQSIDYSKMTEGQGMALQTDIRNYLIVLLGKEQFDDVFKGRHFDIMNGIMLFAYLWEEINKSNTLAGLGAAMSKYIPKADDLA